ncbi:MAG TPA: nuclear transport factor 2 family protein [Sphingomonas sp.]|nr:nuclear transport factor 2 family protein [Sphingomonas sp.]
MAAAALTQGEEGMERIADLLAIERLNADFAHELDRGTPEGFAQLFSEAALYTHGPRIMQGRAAIRRFAEDRLAAGPRTSRHVISGLRIDFEAEGARGISTCTTFSAAGAAPIASTIPSIVADFADVYVRDGERWLFAERHIHPQFKQG